MNSSDPTLQSDASAKRHGNLLGNANFLLLWTAYGISAFGDHLSDLGLMRVLGIEHSTRQVQTQALMTFLFFLPALAIGWLAGSIADRLPRRAVMISADLVRAVIVFGLPVWLAAYLRARGAELQLRDLLIALAPLLLLGLFSELFSPARQALLPQLVRDDQLVRANSITSGLGTIAAMLSNMIGGVLAGIDPRLNFIADAGTFVASALLVGGIRMGGRGRQGRGTTDAETRNNGSGQEAESGGRQSTAGASGESFGRMVVQGMRYVRSHQRVMELILLASLFWTGAAIFTSVLPSVVFDRYHLGYDWVGWMRGTLAGGMLLGALMLTALGDRIHGELVNLAALVGAGGALIGFAWAPSVAAGLPLAALVGMAGAMLLISVSTMMQRIVPNRWRGRVFGITDMATMAGLLAATGFLGLWPISGLDRLVPRILTVLGIVIALTGLVMHSIQAKRSGLGWWFQLLWRCNQFYARWWLGVERIGPCTVPCTGPVILAANHTSYVDPVLLYATCSSERVISFVVAQEYVEVPVLGVFLRSLRCIPATRSGRDTAALREAMRRLKSGQAVGIFPKGRIERPGQSRKLQSGIALLALRAKAPVIPAYISGTYYNEEHAVWTFLHRQSARVRFGRPIDLSAFYDKPIDKELRRQVAELVWRRITELGPGTSSPKS